MNFSIIENSIANVIKLLEGKLFPLGKQDDSFYSLFSNPTLGFLFDRLSVSVFQYRRSSIVICGQFVNLTSIGMWVVQCGYLRCNNRKRHL